MSDLAILLYLVAAALFYLGLKRMQRVSSARSGNLMAASGMGTATLATLFLISESPSAGWSWVILAILIGSGIGYFLAKRVAMTAMPQMVAAFNGFGGAASALVAISMFFGTSYDQLNFIERAEGHVSVKITSGQLSERDIERSNLPYGNDINVSLMQVESDLESAEAQKDGDDSDALIARIEALRKMRDLVRNQTEEKVLEAIKAAELELPQVRADRERAKAEMNAENAKPEPSAERLAALESRIEGFENDIEYLQSQIDRRSNVHPSLSSTLPGGGLTALVLGLSILIGLLTFSGSALAYGKLDEWQVRGIRLSDSIKLPNFKIINAGALGFTLLLMLLFALTFSGQIEMLLILAILVVLSLALGLLVVLPIGGADMPVVVSLLNSYSGIAAALSGFVVGNNILILAGCFVGSAGMILTVIMCRAMNRSLLNVVLAGWSDDAETAEQSEYTNIREVQAIDVALALQNAREVVIVPGYGMAVAQAQNQVKQVYAALTERGINCRFGIHPVAGRMPGHMNVLLAEADIPYEALLEMEEVNRDFSKTDVTIVLGANDVVNPAAIDDEGSPLYGMPILNVHESRQVYIIKRSLSPGYAGVPNPLFDRDNCDMFFGDGKAAMTEILDALTSDDL